MAEMESNSTTSNPTLNTKKRAPGRYLVPFHFEVNGGNGHVTWHCRIEDVDENGNVMQGPVQLHGIDTRSLNLKHKGQHINFLMNQVRPEMLRHYEDHIQDHSEAVEIKGQSL